MTILEATARLLLSTWLTYGSQQFLTAVTMEYLGESDLKELPLLLAGPMLRRTEADAVTVWVALQKPAQVSLKVLETAGQGHQLGRCIFQGERATIALGQSLHIVAVTARSSHGETLQSDRLYAYDLSFIADQPYSLAAAMESDRQPAQPISYFAHQRPTFVLPPKHLSDLKIAHGSCRKPHGAGFDTLPILDSLIESAASQPKERPHQLFLTGDQIYGDDVADPLLWLATALGDTLLGWEEPLPASPSPHSRTDRAQPQNLPAGQRADLAIRRAGLTAGLDNKRSKTTSHLFSFGEYCASYLLAYSPACWPAELPAGRAIAQGRKAIRQWDKDKRYMDQFLYSLWKVRRLIANVPTYTIFDDHDVSDDWNLNQAWCLRVLGKPLGRRTVQNAMLAYAVFQAWGNTPAQFEENGHGVALLTAAQQWSRSKGEDVAAQEAIATYLGLPPSDPHTDLPQFVADQNVWVFRRSEKTLTWHYTVRSACHEVIVLDTRTWRGYPIDGPPIAPPMLLSPSAFKQQLAAPLGQSSPEASTYATFVVAPTNVFGMRVLDWIQQWHLNRRKVFAADVGDAWNFHDGALARLLTTLFQYRKSIVVLSGDIHYSSAIQVGYQDLRSGEQATLVQFTASAIKNEELLTQILHTKLKDWLLPERPRRWIGWSSPPEMKELPVQKSFAPDWQVHMTWLRRQQAQEVHLKINTQTLVPQRKFSPPIISWLKFWNARWLQSGTEVVGVNNIALVHFQADRKADTQLNDSADKTRIVQDHYWFSPWSPVQVVCSRFEASLGEASSANQP